MVLKELLETRIVLSSASLFYNSRHHGQYNYVNLQ